MQLDEFSAHALFAHLPNHENEGQSAQIGLLQANGDLSAPFLVADFPHMNFTQLHEHLRLELVRRIQRGTLSVSLLARETGFGQSHLSNFLHSKRQLSSREWTAFSPRNTWRPPTCCPRITRLPAGRSMRKSATSRSSRTAPRSSSPSSGLAAQKSRLHLPSSALQSIRTRTSAARRTWQRFVAVRIPSADALPMDPLVLPEALAVIDRHYNSLMPYRSSRPRSMRCAAGLT